MPNVFGSSNDRGDRMEFTAKDVRLINSSGLLPRAPILFDHFVSGAGAINSAVPQNWVTTETGAATPFVTASTRAGGLAIAVTGATTNNGEELAGKNVNWAASTMGTLGSGLVLEVRAKFVGATTPADGDFAIGLADAVTYTNSLPFVIGLSSLYTTDAPVEFAGFHYSSIPTSGTLFNSGGNNFIGIKTTKNSVGALAKSSAVAKDSSFHIYRVEIDASANAVFYIDDAFVGSVATCITAATALTPYIVANAKNSHTNTATVDYIYVKGDLV